MFDRIKKMFTEKDEKKKMENLIAFLIILIITLIVVNKILTGNKQEKVVNETEAELVTNVEKQVVEVNTNEENTLKEELEEVLSKISGVGKAEVLLTYSESSSISPLYNEMESNAILLRIS